MKKLKEYGRFALKLAINTIFTLSTAVFMLVYSLPILYSIPVMLLAVITDAVLRIERNKLIPIVFNTTVQNVQPNSALDFFEQLAKLNKRNHS